MVIGISDLQKTSEKEFLLITWAKTGQPAGEDHGS